LYSLVRTITIRLTLTLLRGLIISTWVLVIPHVPKDSNVGVFGFTPGKRLVPYKLRLSSG
jgi:hypothetical protein